MSHYFCPQCQGPEVEVDRLALITDVDKGPKARCPLCHWEGHRGDLLTTLTTEGIMGPIWDGERVANAMLVVATKHAAGPMLQLLEQIGLIPRLQGLEQEYASAQAVREAVLKAVLEAVVTTAFESAAQHAPAHYQRFDPDRIAEVERIFSYGGSHDGP